MAARRQILRLLFLNIFFGWDFGVSLVAILLPKPDRLAAGFAGLFAAYLCVIFAINVPLSCVALMLLHRKLNLPYKTKSSTFFAFSSDWGVSYNLKCPSGRSRGGGTLRSIPAALNLYICPQALSICRSFPPAGSRFQSACNLR